MLSFTIGNKQYEFSDTLRVIYALKDIKGAKSMKEALQSLSHLDFDDQLKLLYISYKVKAGNEAMSEQDFCDMLIDNCGVLTIEDMVEQVVNGLLYSGMDPVVAEGKKQAVTEMKAGATSSVTDSE